jgi:hypothetical protein
LSSVNTSDGKVCAAILINGSKQQIGKRKKRDFFLSDIAMFVRQRR